MASQAKTCRDCPNKLGRRNATGYCCRCVGRANMQNPATRARVSQSRRRNLHEDPAKLARLLSNLAEARKHQDREANRARWIEGKLWLNGQRKNVAGSPQRILAGRRSSDTKLAWCPPHLREHYRELTNRKRIPAVEARAMIEAQHEAEMLRWRREHGFEPKTKVSRTKFPDDVAFVDKVVAAVCALTGVHPRDLLGDYRFREIVHARQAAAYALRQHYGDEMSFAAIGQHLGGRDHSTVAHACREAQYRCERDPAFAELVAKVLAA